MATSMTPNFSGHPGAMGHPGVAVHPMGQGMPHQPGQGAPGGGMPQQFAAGQMGVSAPGGQVNPAMMGGMPPGANPNAHAMQQMTPQQQQQLFQQQQQHLQNQFAHPSAMANMRQQQALMQQQNRALMAHQFQNMQGVPVPMQLNQQQLQQLRQAGRLGPGQHPQAASQQAQAIMAQQLAMQQQAQQQAQQHAQVQQMQQQHQQHQQGGQHPQMAGGPNHGQQIAMGGQQVPNMQQQPSQMGGQQGAQGPQGQQGGQQPQPQQNQQGQSQPPPQQSSQGGTPVATGQPTPSQTPAPAPAQLSQGPQNQAQQQGQQAQPQAQHQQQPTPQQQQQMSAAAQQMALTNNFMFQQQQQQQRREGMKGGCLLKLMQFGEHLSGFPGPRGKDDLSYWNMFVARFFSPLGIFRHSLHVTENDESTEKNYEVAYPAIARYFHTHFSSGVKNMQLIMDKGTTDRPLGNDCHSIETTRASLVYWFETGSHLVANITLRAQFDAEQKLDVLEFITTDHEEYIARKQVIDAAKPAHVWMKEWHKLNSSDTKSSPELPKKGKGKQLKSPQTQPPEVLKDLPDSAVNNKGVTEAVNQFLEVVEVMGQMNPLFSFCSANPGIGPYAALEQYVSTQITNVPNGQQMPQGQLPPGASPAVAHVNLPGSGSPHIGGSPVPGQLQAAPMQLQPSQQGTSSSGPSANTSPASNKRRRPSAVKTEDDGSGAPTPSGGQVNGIQGRASKPPTPRMPKRAKNNPS